MVMVTHTQLTTTENMTIKQKATSPTFRMRLELVESEINLLHIDQLHLFCESPPWPNWNYSSLSLSLSL